MGNNSNIALSPVETRAEAYARLKHQKRRLFWLHVAGFVIAMLAAGGDTHKMRTYVSIALAITITTHILWALQMIATSRLYKRSQG